jgi:putative spermidine/putrescine transport system ATP-binding protein
VDEALEPRGRALSFLVLDRLTKRFGDQTAVDALSLSVEQGEFVALLGPSGCGKTTTLQMIAGFVEPSAGRVTLEGRDLLAVKPAKRGLGIVFQSYALFPHMTAAENVAFGLEMQNVARAEREQRVRETLELVGLDAFADRYPRRMSGGQQQRVALARALVIRPRILLLDEPLSNLDAKLREEMQIELRQIQRTVGATTILVTHDQAEAMALSDRIVVMNRGRAEQIARPHEAYERPASAFVAGFLGKTNVLAARVSHQNGHAVAAIGDGLWRVLNAREGAARVTVRPEKISFADGGASTLGGAVRTRIFQGNHWLYQVETPTGLVTVIRQNSGEAAPEEGAPVRLTWRSEDMTVEPAT